MKLPSHHATAPAFVAFALCAAFSFCGSPAAHAQENATLRLKPKIALVNPEPTARERAPFVPSYSREEFPELLLRADAESKEVPNSCSAQHSASLCYDYKHGRTVYKPLRRWMPDIPGTRPESITLKRDKLAFNYSFK